MPENIPALDAQAITLREHLEGRISALAAHINDAIRSVEESSVERLAGMRREVGRIQEASQAAVNKAEQSMNKRLDGMNEFRQQLKDQGATFVTRDQFEELNKRIVEQFESRDKRLSMVERFTWLLTGALVILQVLARYIPPLVSK